MKELRAELARLKEAEKMVEGAEGSTELRTAVAAQEAAHNAVKEAAEAAQSAHDLMIEWNTEVDRQREKAEAAHRKLRTSKKEADKEHSLYIVSLRCLHSIQDILRAMRSASAGEGQRPAVADETDALMAKLLSGETLSTEEVMQLQRFD